MSKSYVDSIIDTMQNAVWIVELNPRSPDDPSQSRVIHANPAAAALLRCSCSSLIGRSLVDLVPPVAADGAEWWATLASGKDVSGVELDLIGVELPVSLAASALPSREGECRHVVCVAQDMTQRQLAEHLLRDNDRLVEEITTLRDTLRRLLTGSFRTRLADS